MYRGGNWEREVFARGVFVGALLALIVNSLVVLAFLALA